MGECQPAEIIIRTKAQLEPVQRRGRSPTRNGHGSPAGPVLFSDFDPSRELLVGVFLGPRPNGCYGITLYSATLWRDEVVVEYQERLPRPWPRCEQMYVHPAFLVRVPEMGRPVRFVRLTTPRQFLANHLERVGDSTTAVRVLRSGKVGSEVLEVLRACRSLSHPEMVRGAAADAYLELGQAVVGDLDFGYQLLTDPDRNTLLTGFQALHAVGEQAAPLTSKLMELLVTETTTGRWAASTLLSNIGKPALDSLIALLDHPDPILRSTAYDTIQNMNPPVREETLVASRSGSGLSRAACLALAVDGWWQPEEEIPSILRTRLHEAALGSDCLLRIAAAWGLGRFETNLSDADLELLTKLAGSTCTVERQAAIASIGASGCRGASAARGVAQRKWKGSDAMVRAAILAMLTSTCNEKDYIRSLDSRSKVNQQARSGSDRSTKYPIFLEVKHHH